MVEPIETVFPGLRDSAFHITSPATRDYNCIAWAVGKTTRWWWPDLDPDNDAIFWPAGVACEETVEAFVAALATRGFAPCSGEESEAGLRKLPCLQRPMCRSMPLANYRAAAGQASWDYAKTSSTSCTPSGATFTERS